MVRITENPVRIAFALGESAANAFTTAPIRLPVVAIGSKVQAIELMAIQSSLQPPDPEAAQTNRIQAQVTRDLETTIINYDDPSLIYRRVITFESVTGAAGEVTYLHEENLYAPMHDGDGNGELLVEQIIHLAIQGIGNAGSKTFSGYLLVHLVEVDAAEVAAQALLNDT